MQESGARVRPLADPQQEADEDHPVREYIGSLASELAQMARRDGDEPLGAVLDAAALMAQRPA